MTRPSGSTWPQGSTPYSPTTWAAGQAAVSSGRLYQSSPAGSADDFHEPSVTSVIVRPSSVTTTSLAMKPADPSLTFPIRARNVLTRPGWTSLVTSTRFGFLKFPALLASTRVPLTAIAYVSSAVT